MRQDETTKQDEKGQDMKKHDTGGGWMTRDATATEDKGVVKETGRPAPKNGDNTITKPSQKKKRNQVCQIKHKHQLHEAFSAVLLQQKILFLIRLHKVEDCPATSKQHSGRHNATCQASNWTKSGGKAPWPGFLLVGELVQVPHYPETRTSPGGYLHRA